MAWIKNIEHEKCLAVTDEVSYQPGQIVSKTLAQTRHHSLTLFAFDQGEAISTHESGGDAMVLGLDGQGVITIDGREAKSYSSQGQTRTAALALKLAEAALLAEALGEKPVILLDDVMSELDASRQDYLLNKIQGWQVFITCCDPNSISGLSQGRTFYVENGEIRG